MATWCATASVTPTPFCSPIPITFATSCTITIATTTRHNVDYAMLRRLLGNGLLTSDGAFWLRQRRLMAPMFHRQRVAGFCNLMVNSTLEMFELWEELALIGEPYRHR